MLVFTVIFDDRITTLFSKMKMRQLTLSLAILFAIAVTSQSCSSKSSSAITKEQMVKDYQKFVGYNVRLWTKDRWTEGQVVEMGEAGLFLNTAKKDYRGYQLSQKKWVRFDEIVEISSVDTDE